MNLGVYGSGVGGCSRCRRVIAKSPVGKWGMSSVGGSGWEEVYPRNRVDTLFEGVIVSLANTLVMGVRGQTLGGVAG
jgi:hypothetical protein